MPEGGQRLVSRSGHDEHFGDPGVVGSGVGTTGGNEGGLITDVAVGTTEVVVGVSQAVGSGLSRMSWNVAAPAKENAVGNARRELRSMVQAGARVGGVNEDDILI